jgi:hypothetical protein
MTVRELNPEQLNELRWALWWDGVADEDGSVKNIDGFFSSPDAITDEVVYDHYDGINFVNDDFCCTAGK